MRSTAVEGSERCRYSGEKILVIEVGKAAVGVQGAGVQDAAIAVCETCSFIICTPFEYQKVPLPHRKVSDVHSV